MILPHMSVVLEELSRSGSMKLFYQKLGLQVGSLQSITTKYLADDFLLDFLFVDTKNDLNVYYQGNQEASKCCLPNAPGTAPSKPDYDVNEWVGQYSDLPPTPCRPNPAFR